MSPGIHGDFTKSKNLLITCVISGTASPKNSLDPADQLHHPEGLGYIVIRAKIQCLHLIEFRSLGRHHNHRNRFRLTVCTKILQQ